MIYRLTRWAETQMEAVLLESARVHGLAAADRYGLLMVTAMQRLGDAPLRVGSTEFRDVPGVRIYPLRLARLAVEPALRVGTPRHLLVYRVGSESIVEVLGVVHDRMVLSRAVQAALRDVGDELPEL